MLSPYRAFGVEYYCPGLVTDWVGDDDVPAVLAMVRQHEGELAAQIAAHWLERQRRGALLVRDTAGAVLGFAMMVALHEATADDFAADPGAATVWRYARHTAPLAPGDSAILVRSWMARDTYQDPSPIQSLLFVAMGAQLFTVPRLAWSFTTCADFQRWTPTLWLTGAPPIPDAAFEVEGRRAEVFGRDWRAPSLPALRALLTEVVGSLGASPRRAKLQRALHHTYLEPVGSQERVAELLNLPFSTYRDHLKAGLQLVGEILRQRETGTGVSRLT